MMWVHTLLVDLSFMQEELKGMHFDNQVIMHIVVNHLFFMKRPNILKSIAIC